MNFRKWELFPESPRVVSQGRASGTATTNHDTSQQIRFDSMKVRGSGGEACKKIFYDTLFTVA